MFSFYIILIIGLLTTFTDLKSKKIYNQHLIIGAVLSIVAAAYTAILHNENTYFHIINGLTAFIIGFLMYRSALWRGGDAKLFTLYAFLMPPPVLSHIPFPSTISLFACSFVAGMLILFPIFIKDIIINHNEIITGLFSQTNRQALFKSIMCTLVYSWAIFPLQYFLKITSPVFFLTIMFLLFSWDYKIKKVAANDFIRKYFKKRFYEFSICIIFGLLMRLWLAPDSLTYSNLIRYIIMIILSITISTMIHSTLNHFKNYQDARVPFAPLLFTGCILSYTPFLAWLTYELHQWKFLIYR